MLFYTLALAALNTVTPTTDLAQGLSTESLLLSAQSVVLEEGGDETPALTEDTWSGGVTAGITYSDGNTSRKSASITADAIKDYVNKDRWTTSLFWNYAEEGDFRTQRRAGIRSQFDMALDEVTYWYVNGSADADEQAGLDLRWTAGVGLGHIFRDDDEWRFAGEAGLSYFNEEFDDNTDADYIAARLAYRATWHYSEKLTLTQFTEVFPSLEESDDVYARIDTRALYQLSSSMIAQLQWVWDWDNTPAAGRDRSDHLVLGSIGWTY